jgi:hypothetical protein
MLVIIKDYISALVYLLMLPVHTVVELVRENPKPPFRLPMATVGEIREDINENEEEKIRLLNKTLTNDVLLEIKEQNAKKRKILILDLDETLVHSTPIEPFPQFAHLYQYSIDIYIDNTECTFYVSERPHLKHFMRKVCQWFEVVIFTASVQSYADPVIDRLECSSKISRRYFREVRELDLVLTSSLAHKVKECSLRI